MNCFRWSIAILLWLGCLEIFAQDTLSVQTFTWDSDTRNAVFQFPEDDGTSYSKILMTYNMRCHDNRVGNGSVGCREWDYSCNTFITDSSRTDSVMRSHPSHLISNFAGDTFEYRSMPTYEYTQFERQKVEWGPASMLTPYMVLQPNEEVDGWQEDQMRYQFIYTADELNQAGLSAGPIHGMELPFTIGDFMSMTFMVKMQHTDELEMSVENPVLDGWDEVFFDALTVNQSGMADLNFHTAFEWDGSSNLVIELSYDDKMTPTPETIKGEASTRQSMATTDMDYVFTFNGGQYIEVAPTDVDNISEEITVMGWFYGDPNELPANTYALEGVDSEGNRQLNLHLPWGNGEVYFDCGNDGSGYDRINKKADPSDYSGQWNHWAFTKNANTGSMKIYLNGSLWHSGISKAKTIQIERLLVGKGANTNQAWNGWMNELSIWKKELTLEEIAQTLRFSLDDQHPQFDHLVVYFPFEEERGDEVRNVKNNQPYPVIGAAHWKPLRGDELTQNFRLMDQRPAVQLLQGDAERQITTTLYRDSAMAAQSWVRPFEIEGGGLVEKTGSAYWPAGFQMVRDVNGDIVDSVYFSPEGAINISNLTYYDKYPAKFEILSLVTPYGNGLSLGAEGKTFTFDVTDFWPILQGKKRMSIEMGGQWQEELDIQFHYIKGTPIREVLDIQNVWRFARGNYGAIQADQVFEPRQVQLHPDADEYKLRSSITGHGQNGEFQRRNHYVNVNGGAQDFVFEVWKECSTIPIYPQGGTWPFDRAGWCPGDPTLLFENELTGLGNPGDAIELDYGVNGAHMDEANYLVSHQLVSYGPKRFNVNATLIDIVRPSTKLEWERENPSCNVPTVIIQNNGIEPVQFVSIEYGVEGGIKEMYQWAGNLAFGEQATIELPVRMQNFWAPVVNGLTTTFEAEIVSVNRQNDEDGSDNKMTSEVEDVDVLTGNLQFEFVTNSRGEETSFDIRNNMGEVVYSGSGYGANEKVTVDLDLSPGCYSLDFKDSGDDGLYYWFWEQTGQSRGRGSLYFTKDFRGRQIRIKGFESEFGRYVHYDFAIDGLVSSRDQKVLRHLNVFPNPNDGQFTVDFFSEKSEDLKVEVFSATGQMVYRNQWNVGANQGLKERVQLPGHAKGMLMVRFTQADRTLTKMVRTE